MDLRVCSHVLLCEHGHVNFKFALFIFRIVSTISVLNRSSNIKISKKNFLWLEVSVNSFKYILSRYEMKTIWICLCFHTFALSTSLSF